MIIINSYNYMIFQYISIVLLCNFTDEWWKFFGYDVPHLQKFAIRILGQTASSSGCEYNWSAFEHIHTKKKNTLERQTITWFIFTTTYVCNICNILYMTSI